MLHMDTYKQFHLIGLKVFVLKGNLISSITSASLLQPLCEGVLCVYPQPNPLWTFSMCCHGSYMQTPCEYHTGIVFFYSLYKSILAT